MQGHYDEVLSIIHWSDDRFMLRLREKLNILKTRRSELLSTHQSTEKLEMTKKRASSLEGIASPTAFKIRKCTKAAKAETWSPRDQYRDLKLLNDVLSKSPANYFNTHNAKIMSADYYDQLEFVEKEIAHAKEDLEMIRVHTEQKWYGTEMMQLNKVLGSQLDKVQDQYAQSEKAESKTPEMEALPAFYTALYILQMKGRAWQRIVSCPYLDKISVYRSHRKSMEKRGLT
ncbi:MAG: hypothetical protein Q9202_004256 [Teloschistes flavicans]